MGKKARPMLMPVLIFCMAMSEKSSFAGIFTDDFTTYQCKDVQHVDWILDQAAVTYFRAPDEPPPVFDAERYVDGNGSIGVNSTNVTENAPGVFHWIGYQDSPPRFVDLVTCGLGETSRLQFWFYFSYASLSEYLNWEAGGASNTDVYRWNGSQAGYQFVAGWNRIDIPFNSSQVQQIGNPVSGLLRLLHFEKE